MKKILSALLLGLILTILPFSSVHAKTIAEDHGEQYASLIKQKRLMMKHHMMTNEKLRKQISKKVNKANTLRDTLFKESPFPNDEKIDEIETMEEELSKISSRLAVMDNAKAKMLSEVEMHLKHKHYKPALESLEKLIFVLQKQFQLLQLQDEDLDSYIELLKTTDLK